MGYSSYFFTVLCQKLIYSILEKKSKGFSSKKNCVVGHIQPAKIQFEKVLGYYLHAGRNR